MALAPDPASASAGQALAHAKKWTALGRSARAIWGLCQGSGKTPYQVRVDLSEPAFKCSCPSRKFPCKHGLALLLMFAKQPDGFASGDEPGWVADWMTERTTRASRRADQAARPAEKPVDPEAQAKRAAQRTARMRDGVAGCRVWLEDLVRRGLAAAQTDAAGDWERAAARLVDAGAGGLASYVRRIPALMASGSGWDLRTVDALGRLHLLLRAAERLDTLPPDLATDVRTALGWTQSRDEALSSAAVADRWIAVGQVIEEEERFRAIRTWLVGRHTGRRALLLDFAAGERPLERPVVGGAVLEGELAFYASRQPLRAVLKSRSGAGSTDASGPDAGASDAGRSDAGGSDAGGIDARDPDGLGSDGYAFDAHALDTDGAEARPFAGAADIGTIADATVEAGLRRFAEALAGNPWLFRWPLVLSGVRPVQEGARWFLVDRENHGLPIRASFANSLDLWRLVSARAAAPMTVVVEWDGMTALPISAFADSPHEYVDLAPRWAA